MNLTAATAASDDVLADQRKAPGMFGQIDVLSIPGAGLRSLDFSTDVNTMFADLFVPNNETHQAVQMEPTPSPSNTPSHSLVRTYGSEQDMYAPSPLRPASEPSKLTQTAWMPITTTFTITSPSCRQE